MPIVPELWQGPELLAAAALLFALVTHKFSNVGKGALGLFQAGDVEPTGGGH